MSFALSLTGRRWMVRHAGPLTSIDDFIRLLAAERGLTDIGTVERLTLSDPMLFTEMGLAVERIRRAIESKETVAIFGDYDADGITAAAQLVRHFRRHGREPLVYLPHRMHEGYGMKTTSIDALHAKGATLIITVDTGIAAHKEIEHASSLGIDVIVTDHHHPFGGRPPAYAVIHPQVPSLYPNVHLSGSGVAFTLVRALEREKMWLGIAEDMALAAIGTIADLVPLTGENRILVTHGLRLLRLLPPGPLKDFINQLKTTDAALTASDIAFRLVPRINASGRMEDPAIALDALLHGGPSLDRLHQLNTQRQARTAELYTLLLKTIDTSQLVLTAQSDKITAGLVGLIAGRLTQEYGRPSLVAAQVGDLSTGSLRSVAHIDIMQILFDPLVKPLLLTCGGHAQAAGCTFATKDFALITAMLNQVMVNRGYRAKELIPTLPIEIVLLGAHLSFPLLDAIRTLEPFGQGNEEPVFLLPHQRIDAIRCVGADSRHLQCRIGGKKAIGFSLGHISELIDPGSSYDIACRLGVDSWNGAKAVQVMVEDVRPAS